MRLWRTNCVSFSLTFQIHCQKTPLITSSIFQPVNESTFSAIVYTPHPCTHHPCTHPSPMHTSPMHTHHTDHPCTLITHAHITHAHITHAHITHAHITHPHSSPMYTSPAHPHIAHTTVSLGGGEGGEVAFTIPFPSFQPLMEKLYLLGGNNIIHCHF